MAAARKKSAVVFDVAKPGKGGSASATSKPVLITNRPVMKDPMVNETNVEENRQTAPVVAGAKPARKIVIKPIHDNLDQEISAEPVTVKAVPAPAASGNDTMSDVVASATPTLKTDVPVPATNTAPVEEPIESENVAEPEDTVLPESEPSDPEADAIASQEQVAHIEQLIEEERYFLPINSVQERRTRRFIIIGVLAIIVLTAAWYNVALDANLVPNTYDLPHSSFFSVN